MRIEHTFTTEQQDTLELVVGNLKATAQNTLTRRRQPDGVYEAARRQLNLVNALEAAMAAALLRSR